MTDYKDYKYSFDSDPRGSGIIEGCTTGHEDGDGYHCHSCEEVYELRKENKILNENLTNVQTRCTELLEEVRSLKRARLDTEGTAKPLTKIVAHVPGGVRCGPMFSGNVLDYELRDMEPKK